jgi:hypothetical protein
VFVRFRVDMVSRDGFILTFSMYVRSTFVMVVESWTIVLILRVYHVFLVRPTV